MQVRVYEDVWEVEAASIEPEPLRLDAPNPTYPLSRLRLTGGSARLRLPVVVLENGLVKATVCPMLGGRVVALWLQDAGDLVALPARIEPEMDGVRGVTLFHGIQVSLSQELDSMSAFDHLVHEPGSPESPGAVMVFSTRPGSRVSLQVVYSLAPESSSLGVEARVFNRSLEPQPFELSVYRCLRSVEEGCGCWEIVPPGFLSPRDSLAFPFSIGAGEPDITLSTFASIQDAWREPSALIESQPIHLRGAAHIRASAEAARAGDLHLALEHTDSALSTLGDDPLAWWQRAALTRLLGEDDDGAALTAAHALSPLEPVLRAEAFLATPQSHGREPSAVLKPLAGDPDALLECVHLYVEAGLVQEASRLIDECLRQRETPLLRYVLAWLLMTHTRMEVEAANEVARAAKHPLEPPFPWRAFEVQAVRGLSARFLSDTRLATLKALTEQSH